MKTKNYSKTGAAKLEKERSSKEKNFGLETIKNQMLSYTGYSSRIGKEKSYFPKRDL